jgi:YD repeat-containing protein
VQTDTLPTAIGPFGGTEIFMTTRNALGQTVTVQDPLGNPTNSSYIAFGNLASVTDAAGNVPWGKHRTPARQMIRRTSSPAWSPRAISTRSRSPASPI